LDSAIGAGSEIIDVYKQNVIEYLPPVPQPPPSPELELCGKNALSMAITLPMEV